MIHDPFLIKKLILNIEPKFEQIAGEVKIINDDRPDAKYSNIKMILRKIGKYLEAHAEKDKFTELKDFKNFFNIHELVKGHPRQINCFFEVILVLCAIATSTKDAFLNKVCEMEMKYVNMFLANVDKYMEVDQEGEEKEIKSVNSSELNKSEEKPKEEFISLAKYNLALEEIEKLKIRIQYHEEDKINYIKQIKELEELLTNETNLRKSLEEKNEEIMLSLNDTYKEIEALKQNIGVDKETQQELLKHSEEKKHLDFEINKLKQEIQDIIKANDNKAKEFIDESDKQKVQINYLKDKIVASNKILYDNESLQAKIKELLLIIERTSDYENLKSLLYEKTQECLGLEKDIDEYKNNEDLLFKDLTEQQAAARETDFQRKNLEIMILDWKEKYSRLEDDIRRVKTESMQRGSTASLLHHGVSSLGMNLTQLETFDEEMTLKDDLLINKDAKIKELENINKQLAITAESATLKGKFIDDKLKQLTDERDLSFSKEEDFKMQIAKLQSEKEKLLTEKDRLEKSKKYVEEDLNQLIDSNEKSKQMDPVKYAEEIKEFNDKIDMITGDRDLLKKENEIYKKELEKSKMFVEKVLNEKKELLESYNNLEKELNKNKESYEKEKKDMIEKYKNDKENEEVHVVEVEKKTSPKISLKEHNKLENELLELKNEILLKVSEIQNQKIRLSEKEELINQLKNQLVENKFNNINKSTTFINKEDTPESKFEDKVKDIVNKYEENISKLKNDIENLTESENLIFTQAENIKKQNNDYKKTIDKVLAEKKDLLDESYKLKAVIEDMKTDNKAEKILKLESEVTSLKSKLSELEKIPKSPKVSLKELTKSQVDSIDFKNELLEKSSEVQNLQLQISKKNEEIKNLQRTNKDITSASNNDKLKGSKSSSKDDSSSNAIGKNNVAILKLQEENALLQKEKSKLTSTMEKLKSLNNNSSELNEKILREKQEMIDKHNDLLANYNELQIENEAMKNEYEEEIENLKNELQKKDNNNNNNKLDPFKSPSKDKGDSNNTNNPSTPNKRWSVLSPSKLSPNKRMTVLDFNQKESELEKYKNEVTNKTSEIQNLKVLCAKHEADLNLLHQGSSNNKTNSDNDKIFEDKLTNLGEELSLTKQKLTTSENELEQNKTMLKSKEEILEKNIAKLLELENANVELKKLYESLKQNHEGEDGSGNNKASVYYQESLEEYKKIINELQQEIIEKRNKISDITGESLVIQMKISQKDEELLSANDKIKSLENKIKELTKKESKLLQEKEEEMNDIINTLKEEIGAINSLSSTREDLTQKLITEKEELIQQNDKLNFELILNPNKDDDQDDELKKIKKEEFEIESSKEMSLKINQIANLDKENKSLKESLELLKNNNINTENEKSNLIIENSNLQNILTKKTEKLNKTSETINIIEKHIEEAETKNRNLIIEEKSLKENISHLKETYNQLNIKLKASSEAFAKSIHEKEIHIKKIIHEKEELTKINKNLVKDLKDIKQKFEGCITKEKFQDINHQLIKVNNNYELNLREFQLLQKENSSYKQEVVNKTKDLNHLQEDYIKVNAELKNKMDVMNNTIKHIEENDDYIINLIENVKHLERISLSSNSEMLKIKELYNIISKKDDIIYVISEKIKTIESKLVDQSKIHNKKEENIQNLKTIAELQHTILLKDEYIKSDWRIIEQLKLELSNTKDYKHNQSNMIKLGKLKMSDIIDKKQNTDREKENKEKDNEIKILESEIQNLKLQIQEIYITNNKYLSELNKKTEELNFYRISYEGLKSKPNKDQDLHLLEAEIQRLNLQMQENNSKYTTELTKRTEDLNFYKLSCEEIKKKQIIEHDTLTSCLYELASQFSHLKNEISKAESPPKRKKKVEKVEK